MNMSKEMHRHQVPIAGVSRHLKSYGKIHFILALAANDILKSFFQLSSTETLFVRCVSNTHSELQAVVVCDF
jgi:hypothetical protein